MIKQSIITILFWFFLGQIYAMDIDTSIHYLGESTKVEYKSNSGMEMNLAFAVRKNHKLNYSISFTNGLLDSVLYSYDTCQFKILHIHDSTKQYEAIDGYGGTFPYMKGIAGPMHALTTGACRNDRYTFYFEYDSLANAIKRMTQNYNDPAILGHYQFEGILITFKQGKTRYLTIMDSKQMTHILMYFRKSGRVKKIIVLDQEGANGPSMSLYRKYNFRRNKFR
jgi:hypothetical protein